MPDNPLSLNSTRVLAVILTHDRPEELERCVNTALSTLGSEDLLIVLDDSSPDVSGANAALLVRAARGSMAQLCHIAADRLHKEVSRVLGGRMAQWQLKTARRDIAPLRNLSLLVSATSRPQTTVLIDDDVFSFDVDRTHQICAELRGIQEGLITGATISGLTDLDTLTRLANAMRFLTMNNRDISMSIWDLFRLNLTDDNGSNYSGCVSAGYMAFRLLPANVFAFPPGYNEDWLWCLLHRASGGTRVLKTDQVVLHEPLRLRCPTREDILFETSGDLILDCILERPDGGCCMPESTLQSLSELAPDLSALPSSRAESILTQFQNLPKNDHVRVLTELQNHGLTLLQSLLAAGELEIDGSTTLSMWSADALAKHRSFAATIQNSVVLSTVGEALSEGKQ